MADYWIEEDDPYYNKEHNVLKNIAGITNQDQLNIYEDAVADASMLEVLPLIKSRKIDFDLWKDIHKVMFGDVYEWAGKLRSVRMTKGISMFANPQFIEKAGNDLFKKLEQEKFLQNLSTDKLAEKLSFYYNELNAIHPFREGNGRSLKIIINEIARRCDYDIHWDEISFQDNVAASIEGFNGNYIPFTTIFKNTLHKI